VTSAALSLAAWDPRPTMGHVSPGPRVIPDVGFPESGWRPVLSRRLLPRRAENARANTPTPRPAEFEPALGSICLGRFKAPPQPPPVLTESSFALARRYRARRTVGRYVRSRYAAVIAPTNSCARPSSSDGLRVANPGGLGRLLLAPAARRPFPTLSPQSLSRSLDPYPAAFPRCMYLFPSPETSALR
jgi:hypothetical protein